MLVALASASTWLAWPLLDAPSADAQGERDDAGGADRVRHLGAVVGRVRDGNGDGVQGLVVRVASHGLETTTGAEGDYHFYSVPAGPVTVTVEVGGETVTQRLVQVREGIVHQINMRLGRGGDAPSHALVLHFDGRVTCGLAALGATALCAEGAEHVVNVTGPWRFAVVEIAWEDARERLNLTVGFTGERDAVTGRTVTPHGTEGTGPLRLVVPLDDNATDLVAHASPASDAASVHVDVPYVAVVTLFPTEPPAEYAAANATG